MRCLSSTFLEALQATGDPSFRQVARETMNYVLGRMTGTHGAFHSTEDADSEGVEGKYYVWSLAEITERARMPNEPRHFVMSMISLSKATGRITTSST